MNTLPANRHSTLLLAILLAALSLIALIGLTAGAVSAAPGVCYATPDGGTFIFQSTGSAQALRDAVAAAPSGGEVWVAGTCSGAVSAGGSNQVVWLDKSLTIAGYDYDGTWHPDPAILPDLDAAGGGRVVRIGDGLSVTLENLRLLHGQVSGEGGGILTGESNLTLRHTIVYSNQAGGTGGGLSSHGPAYLVGSQFENNRSEAGGGALSTFDSLTLTGTHFISNTTTAGNGGAIISLGAGDDVLQMQNTHFAENRCTNAAGCSGGALVTYNPLTIRGSSFSANQTSGTGFDSGGGALYTLARTVIEGTRFEANQTPANGAAIYVQAPLTIDGSELIANVSGRNGGAIYSSGNLVVEDTLFQQNHSTVFNFSGGAIYNTGALSLFASRVISNQAYNSGGIHNVEGASLLIERDTTFAGNRATGSFGSGGAVGNRGQMTVAGTLFAENWAGSGGGAIDNRDSLQARAVIFRENSADRGGAIASSGNATIEDALFEGNEATGQSAVLGAPGGGAIRISSGLVSVVDSNFVNNRAMYRGGAVYSAGRLLSRLTVANSYVTGNTADSGGGFYLLNKATIETTRILSNSAAVGGGLTIGGESELELYNNFVGNNTSSAGGDALYFDANGEDPSRLIAIHNTIADPAGTGGVALETIGTLPGHDLELTNNIITGYDTGIHLQGITDTAVIDSVLWHQVAVTATGGIITAYNEYQGDPAFVAPAAGNYLIRPESAALDLGRATALVQDIELEPRPQFAAPDLGADELLSDAAGIGNYVWHDQDSDGRQDAGESGLAGVTVTLLDSGGTAISSTTTNLAGYYFFADMAPGSYRVEFTAPAGYRFTPPDRGDDAGDSDAHPATGRTPLFSFDGDASDHTWDAGLSQDLPDIYLRKTASTTFVNPGDNLTFQLTFGNQGPGVVTGVTLTDLLPVDLLTDISYEVSGVVVTPTGGSTYTWQVSPLPAGTEGMLTVKGRVPLGVAGGTSLENSATITGAEEEQTEANNQAEVLVTVADAAPLAQNDRFTTGANTPLTGLDPLANDQELNGEKLYLTAVHSDTLRGRLVSQGDGTFTYDPAGEFSGLAEGETAVDIFTYTIRDEGNNVDSATVTITVVGEKKYLYLPIIMR